MKISSLIHFLIYAAALLLMTSCGPGLQEPTAVGGGGGGSGGGGGGSGGGGSKRIYETASTYTGNLGGSAGADTKCSVDANKPAGVTSVKAIIVDAARVACTTANCSGGVAEHTNWVLAPSTQYVRADGSTVIGTTTSAGIFSFPLTTSVFTAGNSNWTGMSSDWTSSANHCTNWTTGAAGSGESGIDNSTANIAFGGLGFNCTNLLTLYCAEQ